MAAVTAMTAVTAVHEEMHSDAQHYQQEQGKSAEDMGLVFAPQEKACGAQKDEKRNPLGGSTKSSVVHHS